MGKREGGDNKVYNNNKKGSQLVILDSILMAWTFTTRIKISRPHKTWIQQHTDERILDIKAIVLMGSAVVLGVGGSYSRFTGHVALQQLHMAHYPANKRREGPY